MGLFAGVELSVSNTRTQTSHVHMQADFILSQKMHIQHPVSSPQPKRPPAPSDAPLSLAIPRRMPHISHNLRTIISRTPLLPTYILFVTEPRSALNFLPPSSREQSSAGPLHDMTRRQPSNSESPSRSLIRSYHAPGKLSATKKKSLIITQKRLV
jgi:hypothetical protein